MNELKVYHVKVDAYGRIRLPLEVRKRHGIKPSDWVTLIDGDDGIRIVFKDVGS